MIADRRAHPPGRARSIRVLIAVVGLVLVLAAANACSGDESDATTTSTLDPGSSEPTAPPVDCYTAAQADPTGPLTVSIGAQFALVLEAEPATGYSWQPIEPADPSLLLTVGTEFSDPGECGVDAESQVLRYVGRAPGTATISLRYSRPAAAAEGDTAVTFTVNVVDPTTTTTPPPVDTSIVDTTPTTATRATTTTTRARSTTTTRPRTTTTTGGTTATP